MENVDNGGYLLIALFLLVLAVLWILLPFAVFKISSKIQALEVHARKTNALLERIAGPSDAGRPEESQNTKD